MAKRKGTGEVEKKDAVTRLNHHEKILHLVVDRLNIHDRRLDQLTTKANLLSVDLDGVVEWIDMGTWGRFKERVSQLLAKRKGGEDVEIGENVVGVEEGTRETEEESIGVVPEKPSSEIRDKGVTGDSGQGEN